MKRISSRPFRSIGFASAAWLFSLGVQQAAATETKVFRAQSAPAFLAGTFDGVSLDPDGRLRLAEAIERTAEIEEPFVFAAAPFAQGDGWVLGTGNSGRVLAVDARGQVARLFEVPEPEIFAVAVAADGSVYAGSSPDGKIYRQRKGAKPGEFEVVFAPGERYIWALGFAAGGDLLVATGIEGKLFAVDGAGRSRLVVDSDAAHLRSILPRPDGTVLVGTASDGRVLEVKPGATTAETTVRTIYDSALAEVVGFAADAPAARRSQDGVYVAILDSEAGFVETAGTPAPAAAAEGDKPAEAAVKVEEAVAPARRPGAPKSEIVRLGSDGRVEPIRSLSADTVFSLTVHDGRLWLGTGLEGKLWSLRDDGLVLEKDFDERQIVALGSRGGRLAVATSNGAAFHRSTGKLAAKGTFTSEVLDAASSSRFGSLRWRGAGDVRLAWRVGNALEPDDTWTAWSTPPAKAAAGTREFAVGPLPVARYFQWRAEFDGSNQERPSLSAVEITYRALNVPPRLRRFAAMDPGEVLVAQNFNPTSQVYEPAHPNRDGMFTTLGGASPTDDGRLKTLWKKGMRTLRWEAEDANQDALVYRLWVRREAAPSEWLLMAEDLSGTNWSFDETALPDGAYRFKVEASDVDANQPGEGATVERESEPLVVDSTPPRRVAVRHEKEASGAWWVEVEDAASPLRRAEWSADGAAWEPAVAADGMVDGQRETLRVEAPAGARFLVLRVQDAAFNVAVIDLSEDRVR